MERCFEVDESHAEHFFREGFFRAPRLIDSEIVDLVNIHYQRHVDNRNEDKMDWAEIKYDREIKEYLESERMMSIISFVLGGESRIWLGMYMIVMPGGNGLRWHQDNMFTRILGHMLNIYIALDDIDESNSGLWLSPRSHLLGVPENIRMPDDKGIKYAATPSHTLAPISMRPGDAIFFHRDMMHMSAQNKTDRIRRAFSLQACLTSCRFAESGKRVEEDFESYYANRSQC